MISLIHLYVESKKYNKLVNITKKQTHRYREQTSGYQCGEGTGEGQYGDGGWEVQIIRYRTGCRDVLCSPGNVANILQWL